MEIEEEKYWVTAAEAALRLGINDSRIRQILLRDQERREDQRTFPSARKADPQEEREFLASRRVGRVPRDGVWLIEIGDVERRKLMLGPLQIGRPHKRKDDYADCTWFRGASSPAAEALIWVCDGDTRCSTTMLSETIKRFYERCVPVDVFIEESWEVIMPKEYTETLHQAYQQRAYGKIAALMAPFHSTSGLARVIIQLEASFTARDARSTHAPDQEE